MTTVIETLYRQYKAEQKRYKVFVPCLRYFGYSMLLFYLFLLFTQKGLAPKYFLLNIYAIYTNLSLFVLYEYYKIPMLFQNLFSEDQRLIDESYRLIDSNRNEIYKTFLMEIYGRNYKQELFDCNLDEIKNLILSLNRYDWKFIGRTYFSIYMLISIFLLYLLYPLEVNV